MTQSPQLLEALRAVSDEALRAQSIYGAFTSAHEGYAVLLEEVDELKAEVWKHQRDYDAMRKEAVQIAAMAVRIVLEIADPQVVDEYRHVKAEHLDAPLWHADGSPYTISERIAIDASRKEEERLRALEQQVASEFAKPADYSATFPFDYKPTIH